MGTLDLSKSAVVGLNRTPGMENVRVLLVRVEPRVGRRVA
jgi:hypothetical protein